MSISSITFSPDGKYLAAIVNQTVVLWDVETRAICAKIAFHGSIASLSFSECGNLLAVACAETITFLHAKTLEFITRINLESDVTTIEFCPFSDRTRPELIVGCQNGEILILDLDAKHSVAEKCRFNVHSTRVSQVGFLSGTNEMWSTADDALVRLESDGPADFKVHARKRIPTGFLGRAWNTSFILAEPDGCLQYFHLHRSCKPLGSAYLYRMRPGYLPAGRTSLGILPDSIEITAFCTYFNSYLDNFVIGYEDGMIRVGQITPKKPWPWRPFLKRIRSEFSVLLTSPAHSDSVTALAIQRGGEILASGSTDQKVKLWDMTTLTPIGELSL